MLACMLIKDHYKGRVRRVKEQKENTYKNFLKKTHEKNIYTPSEQYPNSPRPFLIVRCTRNHTIILINLEKRILVSFSALIVFENLIRTCFF